MELLLRVILAFFGLKKSTEEKVKSAKDEIDERIKNSTNSDRP